MGGSRFAYRAWKDHALYGRIDLNGEPVLVIGAGNAAERLLRELDYSQDWKVVGLLEDGAGRAGREAVSYTHLDVYKRQVEVRNHSHAARGERATTSPKVSKSASSVTRQVETPCKLRIAAAICASSKSTAA